MTVLALLPIISFRVRHERTERSATADRTEATLANEPTEKADKHDPIEPTDRTEPTEAIDKIEPREPMHKTELSDLIDNSELEPLDRERRLQLAANLLCRLDAGYEDVRRIMEDSRQRGGP